MGIFSAFYRGFLQIDLGCIDAISSVAAKLTHDDATVRHAATKALQVVSERGDNHATDDRGWVFGIGRCCTSQRMEEETDKQRWVPDTRKHIRFARDTRGRYFRIIACVVFLVVFSHNNFC